MKFYKCPAVMALAMLVVTPSQATTEIDPLSGNYWLRVCTSEDTGDQTLCIGFILGLIEGSLFLEGSYQNIGSKMVKTQPLCVPQNIPAGQREDVFVKFLQDHPDKRHERASILFIEATRDAFCQRH